MIFYDCSTAPNPRRARMFIAEKGLTIDTRDISIAKGEQLSPAFLKVNPRATLPVLVTDEGTVLAENLGIAAYLEARFPEPPLMGETPVEKGLVMMWNALVEQQGGMPIAETFRNSNRHMQGRAIPGPEDFDQIPELAERGRTRVAIFFDMIEERLSHSAYLAGDRFTLADITGFVFIDFARVIKTRIPEENTATRAWFDAIAARPSAAL
ncbi:glutathione S-transferase family protein [Pseudodonghicola flavimaris]|uniref:Glutathione S-transferase n=1 Tax=Pseudodonghicola flavimaris TaxID=3050036 RepID=A0ABT7EY49_9RHOB|nr:glutathione S-transferase [Pseudodonghicola flavimaris]MDK3017195.1 glutathione S-transferase [Pseudodonghicola flavimaris]